MSFRPEDIPVFRRGGIYVVGAVAQAQLVDIIDDPGPREQPSTETLLSAMRQLRSSGVFPAQTVVSLNPGAQVMVTPPGLAMGDDVEGRVAAWLREAYTVMRNEGHRPARFVCNLRFTHMVRRVVEGDLGIPLEESRYIAEQTIGMLMAETPEPVWFGGGSIPLPPMPEIAEDPALQWRSDYADFCAARLSREKVGQLKRRKTHCWQCGYKLSKPGSVAPAPDHTHASVRDHAPDCHLVFEPASMVRLIYEERGILTPEEREQQRLRDEREAEWHREHAARMGQATRCFAGAVNDMVVQMGPPMRAAARAFDSMVAAFGRSSAWGRMTPELLDHLRQLAETQDAPSDFSRPPEYIPHIDLPEESDEPSHSHAVNWLCCCSICTLRRRRNLGIFTGGSRIGEGRGPPVRPLMQ